MSRLIILLVVGSLVALPVSAKPNKGKKDKPYKQNSAIQGELASRDKFNAAERNMIRAHLLGRSNESSRKGHDQLPPGLQKKVARGKSLPPGWQKKVAPGRSLDYQIYRQGQSLPEEILRRLPPVPAGTEVLQVEDKIMKLNSATRTILDVFDLAPAAQY